jgi:hypothetical protein
MCHWNQDADTALRKILLSTFTIVAATLFLVGIMLCFYVDYYLEFNNLGAVLACAMGLCFGVWLCALLALILSQTSKLWLALVALVAAVRSEP